MALEDLNRRLGEREFIDGGEVGWMRGVHSDDVDRAAWIQGDSDAATPITALDRRECLGYTGDQVSVVPPSTARLTPVTNSLAAEQRKRAA